MSADVWIRTPNCPTCGRAEWMDDSDLNITYNLSPMLREAGFWGWSAIEGKDAHIVGTHILAVLNGMQTDPARWRAMNPGNKWGDYDTCLQGRMRAWAHKCLDAPDGSVIGANL